jgi:hypothetical protein
MRWGTAVSSRSWETHLTTHIFFPPSFLREIKQHILLYELATEKKMFCETFASDIQPQVSMSLSAPSRCKTF